MHAYVAVTDYAWYEFLFNKEDLDEVNFWQPHPWGGEFGVLERGQPLLFKLKTPYNAIAGGGFFERYATLPLSLAWRAFGEKNGAPTLEAVRDRIERLRRSESQWWEDYEIGCILLSEPFFWSENLWIPKPSDWKKNIVRGRTYDLSSGIGETLWEQVVERLEGSEPVAEQRQLRLDGGYADLSETRRRIGQGIFRVAVTDAYKRQCAITRERALPALDAAHIRPFSQTEEHYVQNGLLLRSDVHRLFDAGYITVTPEYRVKASQALEENFDDGESYRALHGSQIWTPDSDQLNPDPEALRWHNENRYRG